MKIKTTRISALLLLLLPFASYLKAQDSVMVKPLELKKKSADATPQKSLSYPVLVADNSDLGKQLRSLNFESARKSLLTQLTQARRKKQDTSALEHQLAICDNGIAALQSTNKVVFIDSVVVDKNNFLSSYKFDSELGSISLSADHQTTTFTNELGNVTYRAEKDDKGAITVNSYFIEDGQLTNKTGLRGIELDGDINYPFLLSDGTTFYFASRSVRGHGNYDLYVTRYDSESGTYLQPTNLGFPFNSYANDYLMVIDDNLGIGWFASDRSQPEGKVCIYTFIQPKSRTAYDYETDSHATIINAARIHSIKDTWRGNEDAIRTARQQLTLKQNALKDSPSQYDFTFVINDRKTYHSLSDFKSPQAKAKFQEYQKKLSSLSNTQSTLTQLRQNPQGATIRTQILQLEQEVTDLSTSLRSLTKQIRSLELQ